MNAVALNVTEVPGQIVVALGATVTDGVTRAFTVIVITLLVAVAGAGQVTLGVITTDTAFVFTSVEEVNVGLFVPTGEPLTYH